MIALFALPSRLIIAGMATTRKARRKSPPPEPKGKCFTIMPFGGWFDQYWEQIFRPAAEAAALRAVRADDVFRPGTIMSDIWRLTREADVVLADLTTRNGNVFYELGLAHAIGKPAVLVAESIEEVPFDLRGLRVVLYNRSNPDWGSTLRKALTASLRETIDNPSISVPSTFVSERENTKQPEMTPQQRELLQLSQDVELLKRQVASVLVGERPEPSAEKIRALLEAMPRNPRSLGSLAAIFAAA